MDKKYKNTKFVIISKLLGYNEEYNIYRTHTPVMLNWVALSSCSRWSSSLRPPPNTDEDENAGGGSGERGERGLHTVLRDDTRRKVTQTECSHCS